MKKAEIVCVGKIKEKFISDGISEYKKRIGKYAELSITELVDQPREDVAVHIESKEILSKLDSYVILLDLKGKEISSEELSSSMEKAYLSYPKIQFVIGGSNGVDDSVRAKANLIIRFGKVTYPHMLMRLILCEQIYRAFSIAAGSPYHK
ncbi:MAG: 23S rRNA (pseudouridine(1915)-N(3))-methyltransferase RlmH [Clostridia bacterium]|nr:23S rRNA (pseudouridine(1915)-N(3))-methyltransferase RlmH [Clostridia bacterium]